LETGDVTGGVKCCYRLPTWPLRVSNALLQCKSMQYGGLNSPVRDPQMEDSVVTWSITMAREILTEAVSRRQLEHTAKESSQGAEDSAKRKVACPDR